MPEFVRSAQPDGTVKVERSIDAALDEISRLLMEVRALELELSQYRTIVPVSTVDPAHV